MKKGWMQTWKNLLFQHFEITDREHFTKYLPRDCEFDSFDGKYYLGLVLMQMSDVRHKSMENFVWFKNYNELNVRAYITHKGKRGVLFLSLDVDSLVSMIGARVFYGLPYRAASFERVANNASVFRKSSLHFQVEYKVLTKPKRFPKDSFAFWATERYFFANTYLGVSFMGQITHEPWELSEARATNSDLSVLKPYDLGQRVPDVLFCKEIKVQTNALKRI